MDIDYVSYSPHFFIRFRPGLVVFGHENLPPKVHLTYSFAKEKEDANFHITKENGNESKPSIKVAITDKTKLESHLINHAADLLDSTFELLPLKKRPKRNRQGYRDRAFYIRLDNIENNPSFSAFQKHLHDLFNKHSRVLKKKRLKIEPSLMPALELWATSRKVKDFFFHNLNPAYKYLFSEIEYGFWISREYEGPILAIKGSIYRPKKLGGEKLLSIFTNQTTASNLTKIFNSALKIVSASNDYNDTEPFDCPLRIF